jgi:RNA polymerase sigma-70 factor (ECF subfamily)
MGTVMRPADERRFDGVFVHLDAVARYARRRGARDPDNVAAECMTIAWRRLDDVPADDPLPWLLGCARRLVLSQRKHEQGRVALDDVAEPRFEAPEPVGLDAELTAALLELSDMDREALLLVAWEDLTPAQAARALGINPVAFRVRLHRARRRCTSAFAERLSRPTPDVRSETEITHG